MSDFRTTFEIAEHSSKISFNKGVFLIGSCFSESIGQLLSKHKVSTMINPLGTLFNPISIFSGLEKVFQPSTFDHQFTTQSQGTWFHYEAHSDIKGGTEKELLNNFDEALATSKEFGQTCDTLIITLGTAFVYEHLETGKIVANCHKISQQAFNKRLLGLNEIVDTFDQLYPSIQHIQNIILTVSPVRHTRDTIPLNSVSKSILRLACYELEKNYKNLTYFPSYELILDDLRDYRFFKDDYIHPTDFAVNYVWKKFLATYFSSEDQKLVDEIKSVQQSLSHKPLNPNSEEHQKFLKNLLSKLELLTLKVDFSSEIESLQKNINSVKI